MMKKQWLRRTAAALLCMVMAAAVSARPAVSADTAPESGDAPYDAEEQERLGIISDFWKYVNDGDWLAWAELYTPVERPDRLELVLNEQNHKQHIGILTITDARLEEAVRADSSYAPWIYTELHPYYEDESNFACYRVRVELSVAEENGDFKNGVCYQLFVLVRDAGEWGVGAMCSCPDDLLPGNEANHDNPYYMIKSRDYSDAYIVLPVDYIEYIGNDSHSGKESFDVYFRLPKGWSYREIDGGTETDFLRKWQEDGEDHSVVLIYNGANACVGALGYAAAEGSYTELKPLFASLESGSTVCLEETHYISAGRQLENPSLNVTAVSCMSRRESTDGAPALTASDGDHPLIISYSEERQVFIAFEFKSNALSSLQLLDFIEGIRIY